jgi:threonylcarbamoyladenosine tRNA methylthiotransferase MtaB
MKTVTIATLGCKVNQFESEALTESLEKGGYRIVAFGEKADITIVNTCTVTHRADFQSRQMIRRAHRCSSDTLLIVTGCYAQVDPERLSKIEGVKYLLGNQEKKSLPSFLSLMERGELPKIQVDDIRKEVRFEDTPLHSCHRHTRAFVKVQDGCDARCSYCIVPSARGRSRSLAPERILGHLKELKQRGYKEAVLTGIHLGAYGYDLDPNVSLEDLLGRVEEDETPSRIRLSSIEPRDFSPGLIAHLSRSRKICPHLHIPIQSGDDAILKKMNRNYDRSFLSDLVQELHGRIPNLSIGADMIVGFPGETAERFQNSFGLISSFPLAYLHVFPFSRREGTPAAQFPDRVGDEEMKNRAASLRTLGKEKRQTFYRRFVNQKLSVLVEGRRRKEGGVRGLSRNYVPVFISDSDDTERRNWINEEINVAVTGLTEKGVAGRILEG